MKRLSLKKYDSIHLKMKERVPKTNPTREHPCGECQSKLSKNCTFIATELSNKRCDGKLSMSIEDYEWACHNCNKAHGRMFEGIAFNCKKGLKKYPQKAVKGMIREVKQHAYNRSGAYIGLPKELIGKTILLELPDGKKLTFTVSDNGSGIIRSSKLRAYLGQNVKIIDWFTISEELSPEQLAA